MLPSFLLLGVLSALQDFALVDPHLNADAAVGGSSLCKAVVDVGAQGLQAAAFSAAA